VEKKNAKKEIERPHTTFEQKNATSEDIINPPKKQHAPYTIYNAGFNETDHNLCNGDINSEKLHWY
jgi:hypothetical protein